MSEPVTKQRPSIDFDEFERAMRGAVQTQRPAHQGHPAHQGQEDDPLAELARLVGSHHQDPYAAVFAREAERPQPTRRPAVDFAAIEAGLRGSIAAHEPHPSAAPVPGYAEAEAAYYAQHDPYAEVPRGDWQDPAASGSRGAAPRSRRPIYAMAAVIVAGVAGVGIAFAYKGSNSGPREIAMIKAAPGPNKIQPPAEETHDQLASDASILDKAPQPAPTKVVSREEQPVDLAQTVKEAPRDVGNGITPLYNFASVTDASSVPVPAPPGQAQRQPAANGGPSSIASDVEPIRVKTRSYRPDGTPIPDDQPPAAAMPAPSPVAKGTDHATVAKASTPRSSTPKSTTRVASASKPIVTADRGRDAPADINAAVAASATPAPHRAKPIRTAKAETGDEETASVASAGGFAVQLAAPGSEAEAKQTSARLSQKFASALGGRHLSFHKAESNGRTVYRVRVGSLNREEATSMCEKLKADGGSCFVARN